MWEFGIIIVFFAALYLLYLSTLPKEITEDPDEWVEVKEPDQDPKPTPSTQPQKFIRSETRPLQPPAPVSLQGSMNSSPAVEISNPLSDTVSHLALNHILSDSRPIQINLPDPQIPAPEATIEENLSIHIPIHEEIETTVDPEPTVDIDRQTSWSSPSSTPDPIDSGSSSWSDSGSSSWSDSGSSSDPISSWD